MQTKTLRESSLPSSVPMREAEGEGKYHPQVISRPFILFCSHASASAYDKTHHAGIAN